MGQLIKSFADRRLAYVLIIYFLFIVAFSIMTTSFSLFTMFRFGYDAQHTGYLFAYVGILAVIVQGGFVVTIPLSSGERQRLLGETHGRLIFPRLTIR